MEPSVSNYHGNQTSHVPSNLASTGYVYVRHDALRKPLQRPYDGPFKILDTHDKYFTLNLKGRKEKVSVDRLKPAYMSNADTQLGKAVEHPDTSSHKSTRTGRTIRPPERLDL